jgi:SAM-dependent MidA family methyltransferase
MPDDLLPWSVAWTRASTGPGGFYRSATGRAEDHFATNVSDGPATAQRIVDIAGERLERLVTSGAAVTVTDVGSGSGRLLAQLMSVLGRDLVTRIHWRAVDVRPRPTTIDPAVEWIVGDALGVAQSIEATAGLVIAHELLDDLPCDVLEVDDEGCLRAVLVDRRTGREELGPFVAHDQWSEEWWSRREPAARIEVGRSRDEAWQAISGMVSDGLAMAIDYGHTADQRDSGEWDAGTLTAYRGGRLVPVIPDGSANITAHVAMDSCAAAVAAATTQLEQASDGLWWLTQEMGR